MIMHIWNSSIVRTVYSSIFRNWDIFRGYWCIFSHTHRRTTRGRGEPSPGLFENQKRCFDFWKNGPECVHLWVKFSIQNVALRVSRRKNSKMFPCGVFFLVLLMKCLFKCPSSLNLSPPPPLPPYCQEKNSACAPAFRHYFFCKMLHVKWVFVPIITQYSDSDLMLYTASGIILTYSGLCFFRYMAECSIIFTVIEAYSSISRHY